MMLPCAHSLTAIRRNIWTASISTLLLLASPHIFAVAQTTPSAQESAPANTPQTTQAPSLTGADAGRPRERDRRRAAKLYLEASKLFMTGHFEEALKDYDEAAKLDPANDNYRLAGEVARTMQSPR